MQRKYAKYNFIFGLLSVIENINIFCIKQRNCCFAWICNCYKFQTIRNLLEWYVYVSTVIKYYFDVLIKIYLTNYIILYKFN